jgi:hypothetical protein
LTGKGRSLYAITQIHRKGGDVAQIRLNANVDVHQAKRLKHALVDEGISFSEWLRQQIDTYLKLKEPTSGRRKGKEAKE